MGRKNPAWELYVPTDVLTSFPTIKKRAWVRQSFFQSDSNTYEVFGGLSGRVDPAR